MVELNNTDPWETKNRAYICTVTVTKLSASQSWWFQSCSHCHKTTTSYGSGYKCSGHCQTVTTIPKYRLCLIGTDGTGSAEFVLFG
ncbi:hypothetical protein GUJ93_ZPchr0002g24957 [Zizania palustris]|uniref:Replication factor A C-terminal domain-containing protein n=1 Tax=Zizania palustris TaxID=103762 RepID=A0A8J5S4C3_ZIZPA|nr:hypothetical protein GUJ93_ZPchr0002g24957 [Zizania palustris]